MTLSETDALKESATTNWREQLVMTLLRLGTFLQLGSMPAALRLLRFSAVKYKFADYFKGYEKVEAIRQIFGEQTEEVLRNLDVGFTWLPGYMWTNSEDGSIMISSRYLRSGDKTDIYLDLIHELVHVRQLREGKKLFDIEYDYPDRPTEIEAYQHAVDEARRLGLDDERICDYLKTEWMSHEDLKKLANAVNVTCP